MKIIELTPNQKVKWNCIAGAEEWVGTSLTFMLLNGERHLLQNYRPEIGGQINQLKNAENQTLLIFHHDDWKKYSDMFAECSYTWGQFLRSLKLLCETGEGHPYPCQHRNDL